MTYPNRGSNKNGGYMKKHKSATQIRYQLEVDTVGATLDDLEDYISSSEDDDAVAWSAYLSACDPDGYL